MITCSECCRPAWDDPVTGAKIERQWNGRDVCVSCLIDLKMEAGAYA